MAVIALKCPHCLKERMTFEIVGSRPLERHNLYGRGSYVAFCKSCKLGVACVLEPERDTLSRNGVSVEQVPSLTSDITDYVEVIAVWPVPEGPDVPQHLPDAVSRAFLQAERNRLAGMTDAAGIMYRKALDVGTTKLDSTINEKNLVSRLNVLAERGKITEEIATWSHRIRLLGNEAAHQEDEPTQEQIDDLANLTRMALIYMFEMPELVRLMQDHKAGAGAAV